MLVQALAAYADTYLADALADAAFEEKPVPYALQVDEDGAFAGILERREEVTGRKTGKARGRPLRVPKSPVARNTGLRPQPTQALHDRMVRRADDFALEGEVNQRLEIHVRPDRGWNFALG